MNPKSTKGHATRARILEAAVGLVYERGAVATSVDDILKASGTGKSQFYHYFRNKDHLLSEVLEVQRKKFPGHDLARFNFAAADGISKWLESVRADVAAGSYKFGCPVGNLANELTAGSEELRNAITAIFDEWQAQLSRGLKHQKARGLLKPASEPDEMALFIIGAVEGALLLAKNSGRVSAFDAAMNQINSHLKSSSIGTSSKLPMPRPTSLGFCP